MYAYHAHMHNIVRITPTNIISINPLLRQTTFQKTESSNQLDFIFHIIETIKKIPVKLIKRIHSGTYV